MIKKIKKFTNKISVGLKQEYHETKQIPKQIKDKNYKEASHQVLDIGKMIVISVMWVLPAGSIISTFVMKFSNKIRPSAFQDKR